MARYFLETKVSLDSDSENILSNLLHQLNQSKWALNNRTIKNKISIKDSANLQKIKPLVKDIEKIFNSSYINLIARSAQALRKTNNQTAKYQATRCVEDIKIKKIVIAKKLDLIKTKTKLLQDNEKLLNDKTLATSFLKVKEFKSVNEKIKKHIENETLAIEQLKIKINQLEVKHKNYKYTYENELANSVNGGKKLLKQRNFITPPALQESATTALQGSELIALQGYRDLALQSKYGAFLFEGSAHAESCNNFIKFNRLNKTSVEISIRVTEKQYLENIDKYLTANNLKKDKDGKIIDKKYLLDLKNTNSNICNIRMQARTLSIILKYKGKKQIAKLDELESLINQRSQKVVMVSDGNGEFKKKNQITKSVPVSWRISWKYKLVNGKKVKEFCFRAMWEKEVASFTSILNGVIDSGVYGGVVGIDINYWGVSLVLVRANGKTDNPLRKDIKINWFGTKNQTINNIGNAVKEITNFAGLHQANVACEYADFGFKKYSMKYEATPSQTKKLNSFAYKKFREKLEMSLEKSGINLHYVNPAWSSLLGYIKYGVNKGLNKDQAAAYFIGKVAIPSKKQSYRQIKEKNKKILVLSKNEELPKWMKNNPSFKLNQSKRSITQMSKSKLEGKNNPSKRTFSGSEDKSLILRQVSKFLGVKRSSWNNKIKQLKIQKEAPRLTSSTLSSKDNLDSTTKRVDDVNGIKKPFV